MSNSKRIIWAIIFFIFALTLKHFIFGSDSQTATSTTQNSSNQTPNTTNNNPATSDNSTTSSQASAQNAKSETKVEFKQISGAVFGTSFNITVNPAELKVTIEQLDQDLTKFFNDFNSEFSTYDPKSVISTFNNFAQANKEFPVSARFAEVVKAADKVWEMTDGYEDLTVYPLVKAWGFGPGRAATDINEEKIKEILAYTGWKKLHLITKEDGSFALTKDDPRLQIDMSSIAKGYAVDLAAQILANHGATNYLVEIGGEVVARGLNPAQKLWTVGIEKPVVGQTNTSLEAISLDNQALATSGDYRNFRYYDGKRITHEIDPFTGHSITHNTASLTVIADNCMLADALSTGLYVMGAEKALAVAEKYNLAIFIVEYKDGTFVNYQSSAYTALITKAQSQAQ